MNKQSQLTLSTQLNIDPKSISSASQHSSSEALKMLADQSLTARNIVISKHSVQMDVLINNAWQTLRLSTEQENPKTERFLSANIQLSNDGKGLTITPLPITITLGKSQQLQALLNLFTQGNANGYPWDPRNSLTFSNSTKWNTKGIVENVNKGNTKGIVKG